MAKKIQRSSFLGLDLSPNHAGAVELDYAGKLKRWALVTDMATIAKAAEKRANRLYGCGSIKLLDSSKLRKSLSKQSWKLYRLEFMSKWLDGLMMGCDITVHASLEDYAHGKSNGAYDIGEIGGQARRLFVTNQIPFLLISPSEVKSYAGVKGKVKPIKQVHELYGNDWTFLDAGMKSSQAAGDIADAQILANIARETYNLNKAQTLLGARPFLVGQV